MMDRTIIDTPIRIMNEGVKRRNYRKLYNFQLGTLYMYTFAINRENNDKIY